MHCVCAYMCACMHVCVHTCVHACTYVCVCMRVSVCVHMISTCNRSGVGREFLQGASFE